MSRKWRREKSTQVSIGDYALTKKGVERYDWSDPYRVAIGLSWPQFACLTAAAYFGISALFALLLMLLPHGVAGARARWFPDYFFFSIETISTVGYGEMYPASSTAHVITSIELLTGTAFNALLTGLTFVRFSKPRAKFLFADHPILTMHDGYPTVMLRVGNGRAVILSDAHAKLSILISETSKEGASFRRTHLLKLIRDHIPVFPLTWTLMHRIDATSPLYGMNPVKAAQSDVRLFASLEARDPDLASVVHDLHHYGPGDIRFNVKYVDIISIDEAGFPSADMTRLSDTESATDLVTRPGESGSPPAPLS